MKLLSGIIELQSGWYVRLPYPMTEIEMARYRFGPLIPAAGGLITGAGGLIGGALKGGTLLKLGGKGLEAFGGIRGSQASQAEIKTLENLAAYNAQLQEREAKAIEQKARYEQEREAKKAARLKGTLTADIAKAGGLGSPVAADLAADLAAELELENLLIGYEGQVGAARARSQAEFDRYQAGIYKRRRKAAKKAGYIGLGKTLLTGFGPSLSGLFTGGGGGLTSSGSAIKGVRN